MKLYYIDDEYIKYLRQYEDKIIYNTKAALLHKRIYTGVVFSIKDITYFAPLTSYRRLLENQYRNISSNEKIIINKANKIYKNVIVNQIKIFIKSCCDFKKLEEVYNKYPKL